MKNFTPWQAGLWVLGETILLMAKVTQNNKMKTIKIVRHLNSMAAKSTAKQMSRGSLQWKQAASERHPH